MFQIFRFSLHIRKVDHMALIYFDPYPKIPIIQGSLSILKMYLSLIFLGRVLATGWISKEGLIAQIY